MATLRPVGGYKTMTRSNAREIAVQMIFSLGFGNLSADEVLDTQLTQERFQELAEDMLRVRNLFPAIQVDVDPQDAQRAADLMKGKKLPFGVACRCTADNADRVATDEYYDRIIGSGAKFCWFFTCPAYGGPAAPTQVQLLDLHRRVKEFRSTKPLLTLDFWDGPSPSAAPQGGS